MRALTIWQPWPLAICRWGKRVENRGWAPPRGVVGGPPIALHAGLAVDADALERLAAAFPDRTRGTRLEALTRGAVVAVARVVAVAAPVRRSDPGRADGPPYYRIADACVPPERVHELLGRDGGAWYAGDVGWVLDDVVELPRPIPCRGAQGLWSVPHAVAVEVEAEAAFAQRTGRGPGSSSR